MPQSRTVELRVGLFVLICLAVMAGLVLRFSKTAKGLKDAYDIVVVFPTVSGIVPDAVVQYAGIPVGKVKQIRLKEDGTLKVAVTLAIQKGVVIRNDAHFVINTSGLLGDKYVDVQPGSVTAEALEAGDEVPGEANVDITEAVGHVRDVLQKAAVTIERVDGTLQRLDETVLSPATLGHLSQAMANLDTASTNTIQLVTGLRDLVQEQRGEIGLVVQNIRQASSNLDVAAGRVRTLVDTNEPQVSQVLSNLNASTERIGEILAGLQRGEGTAGRVLVDPTLHDELVRLLQNWRRYGLLYREGVRGESTGRGGMVTPARPADKGRGVEFGRDLTQ